MQTFAEIYCARHPRTREKCSDEVLRRTLYPHARWFAALIMRVSPNFFAADRRFVDLALGSRTMKDIRLASREYFYDSGNSGWLRQRLNLRVSGQRMKRLAADYLPEGAYAYMPGTTHPASR